MDYITLPIPYLIEILTNNPAPHLPTTPRSRKPKIPDFSPAIVRFELGYLLSKVEGINEYLQIFLYENSHAEIWSKSEWLQSNSKYYFDRENSAEYRAAVLAQQEELRKATRKLTDILEYLVTRMFMPGDHPNIKALAHAMSKLSQENEAAHEFPGFIAFMTSKGHYTNGNTTSISAS